MANLVLKVFAGLDLLLVVEPDHVELVGAANVGRQRHRVAIVDYLGLDVSQDARRLSATAAGCGGVAVGGAVGGGLLVHGEDGDL